MLFLSGSAGLAVEWSMLAEGAGDDAAYVWLQQWWNWEIRWRKEITRQLRQPIEECERFADCWKLMNWDNADANLGERGIMEWHWISSFFQSGDYFQLGEDCLSTKSKSTLILESCRPATTLGASLNCRILWCRWCLPADTIWCGKCHQTYFFSTCLLERK